MRLKKSIYVVGATGFVGGAIARCFAEKGYLVSGLARSTNAAEILSGAGITPYIADLDEGLENAVQYGLRSDAVIFAAQTRLDMELSAVTGFLDAMAGTGKSFVFTSGTGVFLQRTAGAWSADSFAEDDWFEPEPLAANRLKAERLVRAASGRGMRSIVVRPPLIWGHNDHGHVAMTYRSIALTGAACYVGDGLATYSNVHVDDMANLFALAVERGVAGALYHGVAGEIPNRWIAEAVARDMGCRTRSLSMLEAADVWGEFGALIMGSSCRSRSSRAHDELDWRPTHTDMLTMIGEPRLRALAERPSQP